MSDDVTTLKVRLQNGLDSDLDTRLVRLTPANLDKNPVKEALFDMLDGIDLAEGDRVLIELVDD